MRPAATVASLFAGPRTGELAAPQDEFAETVIVTIPVAVPKIGRQYNMNG